MRHSFSALVLACMLVLPSFPAFADDTVLPRDPIYMRIDNGWKGFYARNDEFLEYSIIGSQVKLQDAYHVLLNPNLGLMITFAEKSSLGTGKSFLEAHRQSELEYWRKQARKVDDTDRSDLRGTREDIMVIKLDIYGENVGQFMNLYMISVASKDGVYVLAISPASIDIEELVKSFIGSIKLVKKRFDLKEENAKIRMGTDKS